MKATISRRGQRPQIEADFCSDSQNTCVMAPEVWEGQGSPVDPFFDLQRRTLPDIERFEQDRILRHELLHVCNMHACTYEYAHPHTACVYVHLTRTLPGTLPGCCHPERQMKVRSGEDPSSILQRGTFVGGFKADSSS